MKYDTAGNIIQERIPNCDCGLTGGCEKCNSFLYKQFEQFEKQSKSWSMLDEIPITDEEYKYYQKLVGI